MQIQAVERQNKRTRLDAEHESAPMGEPAWPRASRMSAVSRLAAICYPTLLKYRAH